MNKVFEEIDISKIKVLQNIRTRINKDELSELMESIKQVGLLQPIGVWREEDQYILAYGHRRLEACKKLDWKKIPSFIMADKLSEDDFISINTIENIHRKEVSPLELANVCQQLFDKEYSAGEIAVKLAMPHSRVEQSLRLSKNTPVEIKSHIGYMYGDSPKKGKISAATADVIGMSIISLFAKNKLYEATRKEELTIQQVRNVIKMVEKGMLVETAVKNLNNISIKYVILICNKTEAAKIDVPIQEYVRGIMEGEISINKKLLFKF